MTYRVEKEMSKGMKYLVLGSMFFLMLPAFAGTSIFSMNLHCALGDWKTRTDTVVTEIIKRNPEIIGLQEVCYNSEVDMAKYIVEELKRRRYPVVFAQTADTHRTFVKFHEQLLIISRITVTRHEESWLPSMKFFENKYLAIDTGKFWAVTTHLHFALPQIRERQFRMISKRFTDKKAVVFGDLNSNPENGETSVLHTGLWTAFYGEPTYPASNPTKTFDGFWVTKSFAESMRTSFFEVLFKEVKPEPSDHLGIWLEVK